MPPRIQTATGRSAIEATSRAWAGGDEPALTDLATAVRYLLQVLAERAPGKTVEVRVPPFGAVQIIEGVRHTRGTPPNVIEMSPRTWVELATGTLSWDAAVAAPDLSASGNRADLADLLPLLI